MKTPENTPQIVIYQTKGGQTKLDVRLVDETVWLSQMQICELFQKSKATLSEHIKHIFEEGELDENSVVRKFRITAADGKEYDTNFYNLDMIISVGYRVKSIQGTQFRIWATQRIKKPSIPQRVSGKWFIHDLSSRGLFRPPALRAFNTQYYGCSPPLDSRRRPGTPG